MNLEALRRLNFEMLIKLNVNDVQQYTFADYHARGDEHPRVVSYCTACEEKHDHVCNKEDAKDLRLCYISHGSCSKDFMDSSKEHIDMVGWNRGGVMFVMENPSKCYQIYQPTPIEKDGKYYEKWPAKKWYWIHCKQDIPNFAEGLPSGRYGGFAAAAVKEFQLADAYMTNLVKCGLNDPMKDSFENTNSYNYDCIRTCYEVFLEKEIEAVNPKVIFAFGTNAHWWLTEFFKETERKTPLVKLPHPAMQGLDNRSFETLYFCTIAKHLYREGVITKEFYLEKMLRFGDAGRK